MAQYPPPLNYDAGSNQFIFEDWAYSQQTTSYNTAVSLIEQSKNDILNGAPEQLDTLKELSAAIQDNELFGADTISALGQTVKLTGNQVIAGNKTFSNNVTVNGSFSNNGNTTLGDLSSNNLVVNSSVRFYNDIEFGVNGHGNDDKIKFWGQSQFQNKSCFRDSMLNKGSDFYSEGGLYLGKYGGSGTGVLAVPTDVGNIGGFRFLNIENATGNIVNEPLQIFEEGNTKFNFDMLLQGRGTFQGGAVFTDNINAYQGVIDKYATQGLYLGKFSNGRAVLACPNNGSANGFQFCNMDSSGNILNTPFYITQQGVCVVNNKIQINGELQVTDETTITLPTDSVAQSAVNNLTNDLGLKANDDAVVHLAKDETITGYKKFQLGGVIGDETNNAVGFEPQQNGLLYCRSGLDVVAGGNANKIAGGLQVNGGLVCSDISGRNLTIAPGGVLTLPNNVISDGALSSNIPKKGGVNTYSNQNIFTGNVVIDCSFALLPTSTLIIPDDFISQTKIKDINQFIKTTESNLFQNNVVLSFEGSVSNLSEIKNGYFETIFRDPGISPPALLPGQEYDPTYNHIKTFTTDYDSTTVNKLNNLTLKGGDLVIDAGGEFFLNGAKGMTIQGGEILAVNSLMKIDAIQCDKITSATKLQINSGLDLKQEEEVIDGITIPTIRSDLTGAGVIEGQDIQATTILFTDTINSVSAMEFNYLDGATSNIQSQIDLKAPLENPIFTGIPTAPTAVSTTNTEQVATTAFVKTQISDLLGGAGPSIDTLYELNSVLAQADSDLSTSLTSLIGTKAPILNPSFTGTVNGITKSMVGLSNVDNTSDLNKPISTATQSLLDLKADASLISNINNTSDLNKPVSTATQSLLDLKADASLISNINNTSDLNKPVSTATQSLLDLKADASLVSDNTNAIQELGTDVANNNNLAITNANNILLKVDISTYDTEKEVLNTNISNNAISIANNVTAIGTKLNISTYNSDKITIDALVATKTDTNYVDTAISNLVNGAGSSLDTLNELATALGNDPNFATTITNQIAGKVSQTVYDSKQATQDSRLDAIESVDSQQLNLSGGTITGDFVSRQTVNMMEVLNTATVSASAVSLNYSLGSVFYVTIPSATNFEVQITNCNPGSLSSTTNTISLIINTGTYEAFANTCKINGLTRALTFAGGAVDITGASQVLQTISVVYSGSSSVPVAVMSSVVPFSTLA